MRAHEGEGFAATEHDQEKPAGSPATGNSEANGAQSDLVANIQQRQAEYDRLLNLCQQLQRQHRCPGRCVLTGELGQGGLATFRLMLDGEA